MNALVPKVSAFRVTEAVSQKRREKDALKAARTKQEALEAQQKKFQAYNATATKALAENPSWAQKVDAFKSGAHKTERSVARSGKKLEPKTPGKGDLTVVQKARVDGVIQGYEVKTEAKPLTKFRPVRKDHHSLSPNKGGGAAILSKRANKTGEDSEAVEIQEELPLLGKDANKKSEILSLLEQNKLNPSKDIVDFLVNAGVDTLVSKAGTPDILKDIKQVIIPPLTKKKVESGTIEQTLTHQVAAGIAEKLGAYYDPNTLGIKDFESKKLGFNSRMAAYKEHFEKNDISHSEFLDGDVLLVDDIMTTGTTVKAIHENIAGYRHTNREGSKTSGAVSNTSQNKLKGKLHTLAILKNY